MQMLVASLALALVALLAGWVRPREVPGLLDLDVLTLFFVLIVAVACAARSRLFDLLVSRALSHVRTERALAAAAILTTGGVAALVTNDVALLLVVPFTLAFERADPQLDPAPIVVLEIAAANLIGCLTPQGNPQNLFLFVRGGFTPRTFLLAQLPWVGAMTATLLLLCPLLATKRVLPRAPGRDLRLRPALAAAAVALLAFELLAIFGAVPRKLPLLAALPALALLGRRALRVDWSLVGVFAFLFVGVEGLRRSPLFTAIDPIRLLGGTPAAFAAAGALLSQVLSNVPAAILLAPEAAARGGGAHFTGLLYGVNAGGCGTPIASLANLIGATLLLRARRRGAARFWRLFAAVEGALFTIALAVSVLLVAGR